MSRLEASCVLLAVGAVADNILPILERDVQGKMTPLLTGRRGAFYLGGQSLAGTVHCKDLPQPQPAWKQNCYEYWPVRENETIGFTHPFWRDGRSRGMGIVTDEITGTGHSLWGWDYYRSTRVLYGSVVVDGVTYQYPSPTKLLWRPDRLTISYNVGGVLLQEVKFITADDSMLSIITIVDRGSAAHVDLAFDGQSFVNTKYIPDRDGDPSNTAHHQTRNSTASFDDALNAIHIAEHGTAYAKPGLCEGTHQPTYPKNDPKNPCKARIGRLMYDGMHVFLMFSQKPTYHSIARSTEPERPGHESGRHGAQMYNVTLCLSCAPQQEIVIGWAQGDDATVTSDALRRIIQPKSAAAALAARSTSAEAFLTKQVPQFNCSDANVTQAYYYGWANYWMYLLDARRGKWERYGHAQSAANNFLGLHAHDTQYYLPMGEWVVDKETYAHGNALMWAQAVAFITSGTGEAGQKYWNQSGRIPDNMGSDWVSSASNDELTHHAESTWRIYEKSGNLTFLEQAYWAHRTRNMDANYGTGPAMNGLVSLVKMAKALNKSDDAAAWQDLVAPTAARLAKQWQIKGNYVGAFGSNAPDSIESFEALAYDGLPDEWADIAAKEWLLNSEYGFMPPNDTFGAPLLAFALNNSAQKGWTTNPWLAHSTKLWEVVDGLYRHHADRAANTITLAHLKAMWRTYGFTIFPEAWDAAGLPWGDQWYNWGGVMATAIPLNRIAGVSFTVVEQSANATTPGILTICDTLPDEWDHIDVSVPITLPNKATVWVAVHIHKAVSGGKTVKTVAVDGNPLGALRVQPWLSDQALVSATPTGFTNNLPRGHVGWEFVGVAARSQTVTVTLSGK